MAEVHNILSIKQRGQDLLSGGHSLKGDMVTLGREGKAKSRRTSIA